MAKDGIEIFLEILFLCRMGILVILHVGGSQNGPIPPEHIRMLFTFKK